MCDKVYKKLLSDAYIEECTQHLVNKERFSKNGYSFKDVAKWAAEFYAEKLTKTGQHKPETIFNTGGTLV